MLCTSCGADLGARVPKFCVQCGAPLTAQDPTPSFIPVTNAPPAQEPSPTPISAEFHPLPDEVSPSNTPLQSELALQTESAPQVEWGIPPEPTPLPEFTPPSESAPPPEPIPPLGAVSVAHEPVIEPLFPFSADSPLFTDIQGRREPVIGFSQAEQGFPLSDAQWTPFPKRRRSVVPGIAAVALVIILAGVWWVMSGESAVPIKTEKESPTALGSTGTDAPAQVPAQEFSENAAPPADANRGTESEQPSILNLPSLPTNQAGRHNSTATGGEAMPPLFNSVPQRSLPISMPSSPPPPQPTLPPQQTQINIESRPTPAEKFPIRPEQPLTTRTDNTEADATPLYDDDRDSIVMLERMRKKLANCQDFFCRSRVRRQYCTDQLKSLPECRNSSL
jgi:hypothetical protein